MRNEIKESWMRCEKNGLGKLNVELNQQVNSLHFEELKEKNKELLKVAMPVIEDLHDIVVNARIKLTDFA